MAKNNAGNTAARAKIAVGAAVPRGVWIALGLCLALFALHAFFYRFLCDDAFISFRYARNLANGYGLVFNPGFERVEGYTNFLWVLILAAGQVVGIAPDASANPLAFMCGIGLFTLTIWFCIKHGPVGTSFWWAIVPAIFIAANRSFAVWCTSGLETKLFELLVVSAVLRTIIEIRAMAAGGRSPFPFSALLFAGAALTRPDGLIITASVVLMRVLYQKSVKTLAWRPLIVGTICFVILVGGHFLFRRIYYEDWLPNTYYCKVGNKTWWDMGGLYLYTFALEYCLVLWGPLLVLSMSGLMFRRRFETALIILAAILPHATYLASIGGDHFEYRPIDVYVPLLAILLQWGCVQAAGWARKPAPIVAYLAICLFASTSLPMLTRADFPMDYRPGFPNASPRDDNTTQLIHEAQHPALFAMPVVGDYLRWYNTSVDEMTGHFVGLRQEEHMLFYDCVMRQAGWLREAIDSGLLPRDLHIGIHCVGVIPYVTDFRTLDRLGLTDREVAHQPLPESKKRQMAHDKTATTEYGQGRGVDLWSTDFVHPVLPLGHPRLLFISQITKLQKWSSVAGDLGKGRYLVGFALQGLSSLRSKAPHVRFFSTGKLGQREVDVFGSLFKPVSREDQLDAPYDRLYTGQGDELIDMKAYAEARVSLERALATRPSNIRARQRLDYLDRITGKHRAATAPGQ